MLPIWGPEIVTGLGRLGRLNVVGFAGLGIVNCDPGGIRGYGSGSVVTIHDIIGFSRVSRLKNTDFRNLKFWRENSNTYVHGLLVARVPPFRRGHHSGEIGLVGLLGVHHWRGLRVHLRLLVPKWVPSIWRRPLVPTIGTAIILSRVCGVVGLRIL